MLFKGRTSRVWCFSVDNAEAWGRDFQASDTMSQVRGRAFSPGPGSYISPSLFFLTFRGQGRGQHYH